MQKIKIDRNYLYILLWFVLSSTVCLALKMNQQDDNINYNVVEGANVLLCILALISCYLHIKSAKYANPQVFTRTIMATMMMKLFVIAIAAMIYIVVAGSSSRNMPAVFITMGLYIVYSILEVRGALKMLNKKPDA